MDCRPLNPESLNSWHQEVVHLNTLVNDLHELSMSDLGALVYEKERVDLLSVIDQSMEMYQNLIKQHDIKVSRHVSSFKDKNQIMVFGDPKRLKQLFDNLLQNTCRYTNDGGRLKIRRIWKNCLPAFTELKHHETVRKVVPAWVWLFAKILSKPMKVQSRPKILI